MAAVEVGKLTLVEHEPSGAGADAALKGWREVDYALEGVHRAAIYDGERLEAGMTLTGPAIVEDPWTAVVVHPGNRVRMDGYRNIDIDLQG